MVLAAPIMVIISTMVGSPPAGASSGGCAQTVSETYATVTLVPGRKAATDETVGVKIRTAALPPDALLVVADADGKVIGGVSPFTMGAEADESTTRLSLPFPIEEEPFVLQLWVERPYGDQRPPTCDELLSVELEYLPAARN